MERAFSLLEEAPRPREWLIAQVSGLVPPGMAWRNREEGRLFRRPIGPLTQVKVEVTDSAIRTGARRIVGKSLWTSIRDGTLEAYEQDGETWIRRIKHPPVPKSRRHRDAARRNLQFARKVLVSDAMREIRSAATKKGWETRRAKQQ